MRVVTCALTFLYFSPSLMSLVYPFIIGHTARSNWPQVWLWAVSAHYLQVFTLMAALLVSLKAGKDDQRPPIGRVKAKHMAALAQIMVFLGGLVMVLANYDDDVPPVNVSSLYFYPVYFLFIMPAVLCSLSARELTDNSLSSLKYLNYGVLFINGMIIALLLLMSPDSPAPDVEELFQFYIWPIFIVAFLTAISWRCSTLMHLNLTAAIGLLLTGLTMVFWPQGKAGFSTESSYYLAVIQNFQLSILYPITFAAALIVMIRSLAGQNNVGRVKLADNNRASGRARPQPRLSFVTRTFLMTVAASLMVSAILFYGQAQTKIRLEPEPFSGQLEGWAMGPLKAGIPAGMQIDQWTTVLGRDQGLIFFREIPLPDEAADKKQIPAEISIQLTEAMRANPSFIYFAAYDPRLEIQMSQSRPQAPSDSMTLTLNLRRPECLLTFWASYPIEARASLDPYKLEAFKIEKCEGLLKKAATLIDAYHYQAPPDVSGRGFATRMGRLNLADETLGFMARFKQTGAPGSNMYLTAIFNPPPGWIRQKTKGPANQMEMIAQALDSLDYISGVRMIYYDQARQVAGLDGLEKVRIGKPEAESSLNRRTGFYLRWESGQGNHHNLPLLTLRYSYHKKNAGVEDLQQQFGYWEHLLSETSLAVGH